MRIVYFYPQFVYPAGTERIIIDKANYLAELYGYHVCLLTFQQGKHPFSYPLSDKVSHVDLDLPYDSLYRKNVLLRFWKWRHLDRVLQEKFNAFVASFQPDIIVSTTGSARVCLIVTNCPFAAVRIAESHVDLRHQLEHAAHNGKTLRRKVRVWNDMLAIRKHIGRYDLLVALSGTDAKDWSKCVKTTVISNVVHLNPTGKYSSLQSKHVLFAGRYVPQKGLFDLLTIWATVHQQHPDWHLDLFGYGELEEALKKRAQQLQSNIHIHQADTKIFDRYLESSLFVLTSYYEPFGLVMPEAMSCGLPVVAFNCPYGPEEIITDGVDGFIVENRDIQQFANRICQLIESEELRTRMGRSAVESSQRYSAEQIMPKWKELFESFFKK